MIEGVLLLLLAGPPAAQRVIPGPYTPVEYGRALDGTLSAVIPAVGAGWLFVAERWDAGWSAVIGERRTAPEPFRDFYGQIVFVPEGGANVRLEYRPWTFSVGLAASACAAVVLAANLVTSGKMTRVDR